MFQSFFDYLQRELNVEHADVTFMFETEQWVKEF